MLIHSGLRVFHWCGVVYMCVNTIETLSVPVHEQVRHNIINMSQNEPLKRML